MPQSFYAPIPPRFNPYNFFLLFNVPSIRSSALNALYVAFTLLNSKIPGNTIQNAFISTK